MSDPDKAIGALKEAVDDVVRLKALVAELAAALRPFARTLGNPHEYAPREGTSDSVSLYGLPESRYITVGDLRRARWVLGKIGEEG